MKTKSISQLKKKADSVFSKWIRNRDKRCYTCKKGLAEQCGHYISRSYLYLRYDETNCHGQCVSCNVFKNGNLPVYALRLIDDYGMELLELWEQTKYKKIPNPRQYYLDIIKKYGTS